MDELYLDWVSKHCPLNLILFGTEDLPISIKKWFLGLNVFDDGLDFKKWAEAKGYKIKTKDSQFSIFNILDEFDYN